MATYRPDRDNKKRVQFVTANGEEIKAPAFVRKNKIAYEKWKHVIPHLLSEGILKQTDIGLLANYSLVNSFCRFLQKLNSLPASNASHWFAAEPIYETPSGKIAFLNETVLSPS